MISELSELGKPICEQKYGKWNHVALKEESVSVYLVIDDKGNFGRFLTIEKKDTIAEALPSKKGQARLLLDKPEEVLHFGRNSSKKHQLFLDKLHRYAQLPVLSPVLAFYGDNENNGRSKALQEFEPQVIDKRARNGNIAFLVQGKGSCLHEEPEVLSAIIEEYEKTHTPEKLCSICGRADYAVDDIPHGMIKKVPNGQSSGSALVSYNTNAFESYNLKGNNNSSICANCARTYVEGLKWLLSSGTKIKTKKNKEDVLYTNRWPRRRSASFSLDTAMVFWTRKDEKLEEIDILEAPDPAEVARLIESVSSGKEIDSRYLEIDRFYSCTLSGSAARIAIRDWIETSLFDLRKNIAQWFQDIAVDAYDFDLKFTTTCYPRLYDMSRSCQRKESGGGFDEKDVSLARAATYLWKTAIKNTSPPMWMLAKVLQRARLDMYGVTTERAGLIKLILNRNNKGGGFVIHNKLEEGARPVAYICGQIFAKFENVQYAALGDRNAGIRERYFAYAMTSPAAAFGRLFNLNSKHFTKLKHEKPGLAVILDRELQHLCRDIDIANFPATFSLEEQGQFAIGYYHQKQSQFSGEKSKANKEEA